MIDKVYLIAFIYSSYSKSGLKNAYTRSYQAKVGEDVGSKNAEGYWVTRFKKKDMYVHRIVWELINGEIPKGLSIDHINGDRGDNRIENLRVVSARGNGQNRAEHRSGRLVGATKDGKRWKAQLRINGKSIHIGRYDTELEAHKAYTEAVFKAEQEKT